MKDAHDVMTETLNSGKEWAGADSAVSDLLDALTAAGYAVVPVEPTGEMKVAGGEAQSRSIGSWGEPGVVWRAMIAAAQDTDR